MLISSLHILSDQGKIAVLHSLVVISPQQAQIQLKSFEHCEKVTFFNHFRKRNLYGFFVVLMLRYTDTKEPNSSVSENVNIK